MESKKATLHLVIDWAPAQRGRRPGGYEVWGYLQAGEERLFSYLLTINPGRNLRVILEEFRQALRREAARRGVEVEREEFHNRARGGFDEEGRVEVVLATELRNGAPVVSWALRREDGTAFVKESGEVSGRYSGGVGIVGRDMDGAYKAAEKLARKAAFDLRQSVVGVRDLNTLAG